MWELLGKNIRASPVLTSTFYVFFHTFNHLKGAFLKNEHGVS